MVPSLPEMNSEPEKVGCTQQTLGLLLRPSYRDPLLESQQIANACFLLLSFLGLAIA
jgi:hypothetical protein